MRRICLTIIGLGIFLAASAQGGTEALLQEIEANNPDLKAAAAALEQERLANRSETLLADPEVEFNYLWGTADLGNRYDLRVTQSFDMATLSGKRSGKVAGLDELAALKYKAERLDVLQEARQLCIDLVYYHTLLTELSDHLERSTLLVDSYERRMASGDATILDLNKAKLHQASIQGRVNQTENERKSVVARLTTLNGGKEPSFLPEAYDAADTLPADFETWFAEASARNPVLAYVRKELEVGRQQLAIDRLSTMPELTVGYMSEIQTVEKFRGVTVGVNIPLWSGANRVRRSRAGVAAAQSRQDAVEQAFYQRLRDLYRQAAAMQANAGMMRASLTDTDYRDFLLVALTRGEISMIDYLVENDLYYEALEQTLDAEREYHHALAALKVF